VTSTASPSTAKTSTATTDAGDDSARVRLRDPNGTANRFVDGGWWPRTSDMSVELPKLLAEVSATAYPKVWAITYNLAAWDKPPHYIQVAGRRVRTGGFNRPADKAMVSLADGSGWQHVDLVMIAPDTDPAVAERALALAGQDGDKHRADAIIELAAQDGSNAK
jgi:hypothetical protein